VASAVATEAAGPQARARAMGAMVGGLTLANVIGVPLGTFVGDGLGWRGPFWILAGLAVAAMPLIARRVRPAGEQGGLSIGTELAEMRQGRVWVVFLATALFEAALFGSYSYVAPLLTTRAGLAEKYIPLVLLGFGAGALLGTMAGGRWGDRHPFAAAIPATALTACVLAATALWATNVPVAIILTVLLGTAGFAPAPVLVSQAMHAAGGAPTLATALATSAFNTGNAGGSWICGVALSTGLGLRGPALTGLILAAASLAPLALLATGRPAARRTPVPIP
jgi:predicted MFS family arabinose efflux permease